MDRNNVRRPKGLNQRSTISQVNAHLYLVRGAHSCATLDPEGAKRSGWIVSVTPWYHAKRGQYNNPISHKGGRDKSFDQIADLPNSYVLADAMEHPIGKKLPTSKVILQM